MAKLNGRSPSPQTTLRVKLGERSYPIYIGAGNLDRPLALGMQ